MDRIPKSLLRPHQNRPAARIRPVPDLAGKRREIRLIIRVPLAPFIFGEPARQIAAQEGRDRQVPMSLHKVRTQPDRRLAGLDRLAQPALSRQQIAKTGVGFDQHRVQPDRRSIQRLRTTQIVEIDRRIPHV
jgi:hypothetical protein